MEKVIEGVYENGTVTLSEQPPIAGKAKVVVFFLEETNGTSATPKIRVPGGLKHLGGRIPDDFNEPLEDFKDYM